jgi:hypothetical protein
VKPITWPLILWLLATRRFRGVAWGAAFGAVINLLAWSTLGWHQIARYLTLMQAFAHQGERIGFTFVALLMHLGMGAGTAYALGLAPGLLACGACVLAGLAGRERAAMVLCVAAVLFSTSVVWLHYFALLIVPLALTWPTLSPAWALPLLMWVCLPTDDPQTWQIAVSLVASCGVFLACLHASGARSLLVSDRSSVADVGIAESAEPRVHLSPS